MMESKGLDRQINILVVDDEVISLENISRFLSKEGYAIRTADSGQAAVDLIAAHHFDLVITDLKMEGIDGTQVMAFTKEMLPDAEVIIVTGYATINSAVDTMARGAFYYLPKPIRLQELKTLVAKALEKTLLRIEVARLKQHLAVKNGITQFFGHSPKILKLKDDIALFAQLDCNVLITGETGTGKELVARTIYELSPRATKRFIPINCAALSEELVLNELFGHEKDAYTGATQVQRGLLETAEGGVVLLDEIGEMPQSIQAKLLRVLQEKKLFRIGGTREIPIDVRIIAATNRDLEEEVRQQRFRQDLYYRLNVAALHIPPLRERKEDLWLLIHHFLEKHPAADNVVKKISPEALEVLQSYDYPGNVRELENIIERTLAMCHEPEIKRLHLPRQLIAPSLPLPVLPPQEASLPVKSLEETEREHILRVLESVGGNKTKAAKLIGIDRVSLWRKLNRYQKEGGALDQGGKKEEGRNS